MPSRLERSCELPSSGAPALVADLQSRLAVVVTHPWGPLGGNLHNNVVNAAVLYFQSLKITTLRFDFVGWQIGGGNYQVQQTREAADFLLTGNHIAIKGAGTTSSREDESTTKAEPPAHILLVGYSYGSLIAASATTSIPQCIGCVSISPPLTIKHWLLFFHSNYHMRQAKKRQNMPRLMIIGSKDNFTSENKFHDMVDSFPEGSTTGAVLKGADHFYRRREKDLMAIVGQWLLTTYAMCDGDLQNLAQLHLQGYQEPNAEAECTAPDAMPATTLNCAGALMGGY